MALETEYMTRESELKRELELLQAELDAYLTELEALNDDQLREAIADGRVDKFADLCDRLEEIEDPKGKRERAKETALLFANPTDVAMRRFEATLTASFAPAGRDSDN